MSPEQAVRELVVYYGSIHAAGRAYNERYGYKVARNGGNGARLMQRILAGRAISTDSLDRLETLLRG